jgi:hypothetical protein
MHTQGLGYRIVKIDQVKRARVNRNATRRLHFGKHLALGVIMRSRAQRRFIVGFTVISSPSLQSHRIRNRGSVLWVVLENAEAADRGHGAAYCRLRESH